MMQAGDVIILCGSDGIRTVARLDKGKTVRIKSKNVKIDPLIGSKIGSVFEVTKRGLIAVDGPLIPSLGLDLGSKDDNRDLLPGDRAQQKLTDAEIEALKDSNEVRMYRFSTRKAGDTAVVETIVEGSATFAKKTQFSQEKYVKKKMNRHMFRVQVMPLSQADLAESWFHQRVAWGLAIRPDMLGLVLGYANVCADATTVIVDGTGGVITSAALLRTSGAGRFVVAGEPKPDFAARIYRDEKQEQAAAAAASATSATPAPAAAAGEGVERVAEDPAAADAHAERRRAGAAAERAEVAREGRQMTLPAVEQVLPRGSPLRGRMMQVPLQFLNRMVANGGKCWVEAPANRPATLPTDRAIVTALDWRADECVSIRFSKPSGSLGARYSQVLPKWYEQFAGAAAAEEDGTAAEDGANVGLKRRARPADAEPQAAAPPPKKASVAKGGDGDQSGAAAAREEGRGGCPEAPAGNATRSRLTFAIDGAHMLRRHAIRAAAVASVAAGVDSAIIAMDSDPTATTLSVLRYVKPGGSFCVYARSLDHLAGLQECLLRLGMAADLILRTNLRRELQVLPQRTHPHMSTTEAATGYLLAGQVRCSDFCAVLPPVGQPSPQPEDCEL